MAFLNPECACGFQTEQSTISTPHQLILFAFSGCIDRELQKIRMMQTMDSDCVCCPLGLGPKPREVLLWILFWSSLSPDCPLRRDCRFRGIRHSEWWRNCWSCNMVAPFWEVDYFRSYFIFIPNCDIPLFFWITIQVGIPTPSFFLSSLTWRLRFIWPVLLCFSLTYLQCT